MRGGGPPRSRCSQNAQPAAGRAQFHRHRFLESRLPEVFLLRTQLLRGAAVDTEFVERCRFFKHGASADSKGIRERVNQRKDLLPDRVESRQFPQVLAPVVMDERLPPPLLAAHARRHGIVLQPPDHLLINVGHPAFQHAEHPGNRVIFTHALEGRTKIFHKRVQDQASLLINETGYAVGRKDLAGQIAVRLQIPGDNRNIAVAQSLRPHKTADLPRDKCHLLARIPRGVDPDGSVLPAAVHTVLLRPVRTEYIAGQMRQRRRGAVPGQR